MSCKIVVVFSVVLIGMASPASAQAPKAQARSAIDKQTIEAMIRAHVLDYFGNKNVKKESLGIETVNGTPFHSLSHTFATSGRNDLVIKNGNIVPKDGGGVVIAFQNSTIVASGIGDGEGGIKIIQSLRIAEGTRVQLKAGGSYVLKGGRWTKE